MLGFNDLTIKAQAVFFSFLIGMFSLNAFAQDVNVELPSGEQVTVTAEDLTHVSADLDAESEKHEGKVKKWLKKVSKGFKKKAQSLKKNDDKKRTKKKVTFKRVLLGAGKGATFVSIQVARPFVNAGGFLKGFFEKPGKNALEVEYMKIFLNHEDKFNDIWTDFDPRLNVDELTKIQLAFMDRVELILQEKQTAISTDIMAYLADLLGNDEEETKQNIANFVNNHEAYQELRPVLGDLNADQVDDLENINLIDDPMQILSAAKITLVEGVAGYAMKTVVPKMVLGIVAKSLGGAVLGIGLIADAGMVTSALMCTMSKKTMAKIDDGDEELREFCQYVVNKSAYTISKSRMKGYVKGKSFRRKFIKGSEKIKRKVNEKVMKKNKETVTPQVENKA
jgi:hypothetical protein